MCVWQDVVITELSSSAYLWTPKISENFALIWHLAEGKHHHGYGSWFVIRPISVIGPIPDIHSIDTRMLVLNAWCHRLYPIRYHGTYRIRRIFPFWMYWSFCGQWMGIENISFWYPDAIAARSNSNGWFGERSATISVKELAEIYREKKTSWKLTHSRWQPWSAFVLCDFSLSGRSNSICRALLLYPCGLLRKTTSISVEEE